MSETGVEAKIDTLRRLQATMAAKDKKAFLEFFAPDVVYHYHVGSRPLVGREWVSKFVDKYWRDNSGARWEMTTHVETGNKLLTEGWEEYVNASGHAVRHDYMGIIEFDDAGKITGWRDYFQLSDPNATG